MANNRHNSLTTTYYLTLKRFLRQGGKSIADLTKYNVERVQAAIAEHEGIKPDKQLRISQ